MTALILIGCGGGGGSSTADSSSGGTTSAPSASNVYIDSDTGLMWQDDINAEIVTKPWLDASNYNVCNNDAGSGACTNTSGDTAATYCLNMVLNDYADWRLPTNNELAYLYTSNKYTNLSHIVKQNAGSGYNFRYQYWSSTISTSWALGAYTSNEVRTSSEQAKNALYYVRCVR